MWRPRIKRTDIGTIAIHSWMVATLLVSIATGLRFELELSESEYLQYLAPVLPASYIWILHLFAGTNIVAVAVAYPIYLYATGLKQRIALNATRFRGLLSPGPARWAAVNVILYWALFGGLVIQIVTGLALFRGYGGWLVQAHLYVTWLIVAYVIAHVAAHFAFGGLKQIMRIVRPSPIPGVASASGRAAPRIDGRGGRGATALALSVGAGLVAGYLFLYHDRSTRDVLHARRISTLAMQNLQADLSDAAWRTPPLVVQTNQGANFDGTGATAVEIRAVHDGRYIGMAFSWFDPTRSLKHTPLVKRADGWRALFEPPAERRPIQAEKASFASETRKRYEDGIAEDKFAIMLTDVEKPYGPGAFHPGAKPLADKPPSSSGRGMHYTLDGSSMNVWLWHADGAASGRCENARVGGAPKPTSDQARGLAPYKGGIVAETGEATVLDNFWPTLPRDSDGVVTPRRLPKAAAVRSDMSQVDLDPDYGDPPNGRWRLLEEESEPYSAEGDARLPVGSIIPGLIAPAPRPAGPRDVYCSANWAGGRWMLFVKRRLDTGGKGDVSISNRTHMWVAAFDHTIADHTRHIRPLRLELKE